MSFKRIKEMKVIIVCLIVFATTIFIMVSSEFGDKSLEHVNDKEMEISTNDITRLFHINIGSKAKRIDYSFFERSYDDGPQMTFLKVKLEFDYNDFEVIKKQLDEHYEVARNEDEMRCSNRLHRDFEIDETDLEAVYLKEETIYIKEEDDWFLYKTFSEGHSQRVIYAGVVNTETASVLYLSRRIG